MPLFFYSHLLPCWSLLILYFDQNSKNPKLWSHMRDNMWHFSFIYIVRLSFLNFVGQWGLFMGQPEFLAITNQWLCMCGWRTEPRPANSASKHLIHFSIPIIFFSKIMLYVILSTATGLNMWKAPLCLIGWNYEKHFGHYFWGRYMLNFLLLILSTFYNFSHPFSLDFSSSPWQMYHRMPHSPLSWTLILSSWKEALSLLVIFLEYSSPYLLTIMQGM